MSKQKVSDIKNNSLISKSRTLKVWFLYPRAKTMASFVKGYISKDEKILDFGCGDGYISEILSKETGAKITLLDVINSNMSIHKAIIYDGGKIPFNDKSFDKSLSLMVLHHADNHPAILGELIRVTKNEIIITEDVYKNSFELVLLKILDSPNKLLDWHIPLSFTFKKETEWEELFINNGLEIIEKVIIRPRRFRPSRHRLYRLRVLG